MVRLARRAAVMLVDPQIVRPAQTASYGSLSLARAVASGYAAAVPDGPMMQPSVGAPLAGPTPLNSARAQPTFWLPATLPGRRQDGPARESLPAITDRQRVLYVKSRSVRVD